MFRLSLDYTRREMSEYAKLRQREFALDKFGYEAVRHQKSVGAGYFDKITELVTGGASAILALKGSTEEQQFIADTPEPKRSLSAVGKN